MPARSNSWRRKIWLGFLTLRRMRKFTVWVFLVTRNTYTLLVPEVHILASMSLIALGEVYVWDLAQRRCVARYKDFATQHTTAIANSPRGLYQATGYGLTVIVSYLCRSDSGVTNIYKYESLPLPGSTSHPAPQPLKSIMNLRTSINTLTFNHDAQILAMTSGEKSNSIRLVSKVD